MALRKFLIQASYVGNTRFLFGQCLHRPLRCPITQTLAFLRISADQNLNLPKKPKKPLTPFFRYTQQVRNDIHKQYPDHKPAEILKEVSNRWKTEDAGFKEKLDKEFKEAMVTYMKELRDYNSTLTDEQKAALKSMKENKKVKKERREYKQKCKELGKPKRPSTAYILYSAEHKKKSNLPLMEHQKEMAKKWAQMSEAEKQPYVDRMNADLKRYSEEMVEWERNMIRLGHTDVVRVDSMIEPKELKKTKGKSKKSE